MSKKLKCILIDDDPLFLYELEALIEEIKWLKIDSKFTNPIEAGPELVVREPDIILTDIEMPHIDGYGLVHWIDPYLNQIEPKPKVFIVTGKEELIKENFKAPVAGVILKTSLRNPEDLANAISAGLED